MKVTDKKTGREIEVFTTSAEGRKEQHTYVEIVDKTGRYVTGMECFFENNRLIDYDGVFCIAMDVIKALRQAGWIVPKDFE